MYMYIYTCLSCVQYIVYVSCLYMHTHCVCACVCMPVCVCLCVSLCVCVCVYVCLYPKLCMLEPVTSFPHLTITHGFVRRGVQSK